jgi:hypothetical protein
MRELTSMAQLSNGRGDCPGTIGACNDAVEPGTKRKCADFAARILRWTPWFFDRHKPREMDYEYTQHVSSTAVKTIQKQKGQASNETHADGELRDSHKKKVRRDPNMNSGGGSAPEI